MRPGTETALCSIVLKSGAERSFSEAILLHLGYARNMIESGGGADSKISSLEKRTKTHNTFLP
jgi:hypothetical protein